MYKPIMILMCGISGSGKTEIAKELSKEYNAIILSLSTSKNNQPSKVDYDMNFIINYLRKDIRRNLKNRKNIIIDIPNLTVKNRRAILHLASNYEKQKICYVINTSYEQCVINNGKNKYPISNSELKKQHEKFCLPTCEEGFDKVIILNRINLW